MKICLVHNRYGKYSGEESVVDAIQGMLGEHGHEVIPFFRDSAEIEAKRLGRARAFLSGIHSRSSREAMRRVLRAERPELVHIHNLFPLISPAILPVCREEGVPVVMTVHNYRLVCPNGVHMVRGEVCERCCGGNEQWCVLRNCENDLLKSLGYAVRNRVARTRRYYLDNVTMYATLSEFQRERLIDEGFPEDRIRVIPNTTRPMPPAPAEVLGGYVGFAGRVSPEKGVDVLVRAAEICKEIPFKIAGATHRQPHLPRIAPENVEFLGQLSGDDLSAFYYGSRMVVVPSICYEPFGLSAVEAMLYGKPVVCSRTGGLQEIVVEERTGLLFEPGNERALAEGIRRVWQSPELAHEMGQAGWRRALSEYSMAAYYERLHSVYERALELGPGGPLRGDP